MPIGHPPTPGTVVGPLIDADARERVRGYQATRAPTQGEVAARAATTCPRPAGTSARRSSASTTPHAPVATDEIFGPVLRRAPARDLDHALAIANGTDYALTGGLFSRIPSHLARRRPRSCAPATSTSTARSPAPSSAASRSAASGSPASASKAGGPDYLLQFVEPRTITENTLRQGFAPE